MTVVQTESDQLHSTRWIQSFRDRHGRSPTVLHIGNIANNAYNNAKSMNKAGLDCDVLCYDYYHVMGCPEWEDADFAGEIKNQFFPSWRAVNLKGFERPRWFAQGPWRLCICYLLAKRDKKKLEAWFWWNMLAGARFLICSEKGNAIRNCLLTIRNNLDRLLTIRNERSHVGRAVFYLLAAIFSLCAFLCYALLSVVWIPVWFSHWMSSTFRSGQTDSSHFEYSFRKRVNELVENWLDRFPDRKDRLLPEDLENYRFAIRLWQGLFSRYDIIQAYSTDPILPLLAGEPYFAFEHGTLRDIPFQNTAQGKTTALSYSFAEHVFVTNADCLRNAHMLANDRVSFISHPYDEDHGSNIDGWQELRQKFCSLLDADFMFFFPTRHDWIPRTGYADKANDVFLRAFCRLRKEGYTIGMVCCLWGANVQNSKKLLKEEGCSDYVSWVDPMGTVMFERMAKACDVLVDQFKVGSFGGILFKGMAVGSPVCTYLDEDEMNRLYPEVPPVINCRTEHQVFVNLKGVIEDPAVLRELSNSSRCWIKKYHSSAEMVRIQLLQYKKYIEKHYCIGC